MPWLKVGDMFATHPMLMKLMGVKDADERTINEVTGFLVRLSANSAGHMTDYCVDIGTATMIAGSRAELLLGQAVEAGILTVRGRGRAKTWVIAEDEDLLHMRRKAEVEWERQRKRDNANPGIVVPVRTRDGDACRYCGSIVYWKARRGGRAGTYDHLEPGTAGSIDTIVVACFSCNARLKDLPRAEHLKELRPEPAHPYYTDLSIEWLASHGVTVTNDQPAQSGSERAGAAGAESTSAPPAATARPRPLDPDAHARPTATAVDTAAPARDEPTSPSTAATVRDPAAETPQPPPARATPWAATAATTTVRPDFLSDNAATARPGPPDTAPPPGEAPVTHRSADPSRKALFGAGRVGTGQGPGAAAASGSDVPATLTQANGSSPSPSGRRGKRGRRSKKKG